MASPFTDPRPITETVPGAYSRLKARQKQLYPPLSTHSSRYVLAIAGKNEREKGKERLEQFNHYFREVERVAIPVIGAAGCNFEQVHHDIKNNFVMAALPKIVGSHIYSRYPCYYQGLVNSVCDSRRLVTILPRRWGKTVTTCSLVAASILAIPNVTIAVFSPVMRASSSLTACVVSIVRMLMPTDFEVFACNTETFIVRNKHNHADKRSLKSFPAASDKVRGAGADIVIIEELFACDVVKIRSIILPILRVMDTAVMCISTPQSEISPFNEFINQTYEGTPVWKQHRVSPVCDACIAAGKKESCKHNEHLTPSWLSLSQTNFIKSLMTPEEIANEILGIAATKGRACYNPNAVARIGPIRDGVSLPYGLRIYIAVDPTSGMLSMHAMMAFAFVGTEMVVSWRCHLPYGHYNVGKELRRVHPVVWSIACVKLGHPCAQPGVKLWRLFCAPCAQCGMQGN